MKVVVNMAKIKKNLNEYRKKILIVVLLAIGINKFLFFRAFVPSESMVPTLNVDDQIIVNRLMIKKNLKTGDIIVFESDELDQKMIKRIIGLPGDVVNIENGIVTLNGITLKEEYVTYNNDFTGKFIVPNKEILLLGDNRANSNDSRYWRDSFINMKDIEGKAIIRIYPFDDIKLFN